ncbi:hypothetical protein BC940DRAFT_369785 [Gongronella butleri]|nr:hypothetical protein BC940DRAFT_369785 [Gongronella butleri]
MTSPHLCIAEQFKSRRSDWAGHDVGQLEVGKTPYAEDVDHDSFKAEEKAHSVTPSSSLDSTAITMEKAVDTPKSTRDRRRRSRRASPPPLPRRRCHWPLCSRGNARQWVIFAVFFLIVASACVMFVFWPRAPLFRLDHGLAASPPVLIVQQQQQPQPLDGSSGANPFMDNAQFTAHWDLALAVDNRVNYGPTCVSRVSVIAKDALTGAVIGKGDADATSAGLTTRTTSPIMLPTDFSFLSIGLRINYEARNMQDQTMQNLVQACQRTPAQANNGTTYPLQLVLSIHFCLIDWLGIHPTLTITPAPGGFLCPV